MIRIWLLLLLANRCVYGFSVTSRLGSPAGKLARSESCLHVFDPSSGSMEASSTMMLADATWRQYVSLALVAGVLLDIVLGSPFANSLLKPLRGDQAETEGQEGGADANAAAVSRSKERVDSERLAQDAIARAENALELRRFLDERKTDWVSRFQEATSLPVSSLDVSNDFFPIYLGSHGGDEKIP